MKPVGTNLQPITPSKVSGDNKPVGAAAPTQTVSRDASAVSQLGSRDIVDQGPPIDEARIEQIRNAIADGSYAIDTDKLAEKMIELDLLPKS
ncbi:flagellar biosynthesis anti-sigma factor FlgM [Alterisphingorhabdus coralli]|uniref:Negative regulator of flagellin synthesis n=1 Tax=Alterisphingorhabdus coralli TaxID=3071408 RepID=A0AA97F950_9SPHN|nr:flagellar biosynthesis anti-sigma factor FlgM [Parasphingorhabdus sp. SCSIO 66989]WOE74755.1 flagellar biosynthesis anti-sigma factor FlgM [Parasphingorhabdus sp. SCSIO 66989]